MNTIYRIKILTLVLGIIISTYANAGAKISRLATESNLERDESIISSKYLTTPMGGLGGEARARFLRNSDQVTGVPYMNEFERLRYRITFKNGLAYRGKKLLGKSSCFHVPTDYIYVMDDRGFFYIATRKEVLHHSSFLAGGPVAAAGLVKVLNGEIFYLSNESGHYQPGSEFLRQAIDELAIHEIKNFEIVDKNWN